MNLNEEEIKKACLAAKEKGWRIKSGIYCVLDSQECCPLTALAFESGMNPGTIDMRILQIHLELDHNEMASFIQGVDGDPMLLNQSTFDYNLGRKIRIWLDEGKP